MLSKKPASRAKPIRDPSNDILMRSSFDFSSISSKRFTVALSPATLAALMGQNGLNGNNKGVFRSFNC